MTELEELVREFAHSKEEAALFGSAVTGETWEGSDLNVLVLEQGAKPVITSATNYILGDWAADTPRITKRLINGQLFQVDVYPSANLETAIDDWILCDRLAQARAFRTEGPLAEAIEGVRQARFTVPTRVRRIRWYVETARDLVAAGSDPSEQLFATRMSAVLLGCAELEVVRQVKRSYKRMYRQCLDAFAQGTGPSDRSSFVTCYGLGEPDSETLSSLLMEGLAAIKAVRTYFLDPHAGRMKDCPPGLLESMRTTLEISSGGIPAGKGIVENFSLGDLPAALDCLRKATLWLTNASLRIHSASAGAPQPGRYLEALSGLQMGVDILGFVRRLFVLEPSQAEGALLAHERLCSNLSAAADAIERGSLP